MQINRLFQIVYILLNKEKVTAKELSEKFEVSQRTIYRDIETLCQCGVPIYTNKGKGGGISLLDSFILNKSVLSSQEQKEILCALQGLNAVNYPDIHNVLSKLSALFGTNNPNWVEVDFSDWSHVQKDRFILIKMAVTNKKVICFDYYSSYGEKTYRIVEPLQLWFKDKTWYLKAFCRSKQSMRIFKLTRMKNLKATDDFFERTLPKENPSILNNIPIANVVTLKLKIDASQAYRVYDEFDESEIYKNEDGSFVVKVSYPEDEWVYGYILSFGYFVEVLEPGYIRKIIKNRLEKTLKLYS